MDIRLFKFKSMAKGSSLILLLMGNQLTDLKVEDVNPDVIILTHGHNDHVGDTVELAKKNNALVIANHEISTFLGWQGVNTHGMHIGGAHQFDFGKVKLTQAFHGSSFMTENKKLYIAACQQEFFLWLREKPSIMQVIRDYFQI